MYCTRVRPNDRIQVSSGMSWEPYCLFEGWIPALSCQLFHLLQLWFCFVDSSCNSLYLTALIPPVSQYALVYKGLSLLPDGLFYWQLPQHFKGDKVKDYAWTNKAMFQRLSYISRYYIFSIEVGIGTQRPRYPAHCKIYSGFCIPTWLSVPQRQHLNFCIALTTSSQLLVNLTIYHIVQSRSISEIRYFAVLT